MIATASGGAAVVAVVVIVIGIAIYMLPTIVGATRKVVNIGSVFAINLFLGWTLVGWVVALAMALRTNPPHAYPQMWQGQMAPGVAPQGVPQPGVLAPPGWYPDPSNPSVRRWWDGHQWTASTSDQ
jgi:hypothetical protein